MNNKKFYLLALGLPLAILVFGFVLIPLDVGNVYHYHYSGTLLLDNEQYEQFKGEVADYGVNIRPDDITTLGSDTKLVIFDIKATSEFTFGEQSIYYIKEGFWSILELVCLILGGAFVFTWLVAFGFSWGASR